MECICLMECDRFRTALEMSAPRQAVYVDCRLEVLAHLILITLVYGNFLSCEAASNEIFRFVANIPFMSAFVCIRLFNHEDFTPSTRHPRISAML